ncbi:MAG: type II toxin-antitoxin system RelE/ParE family toxin [Gammaproteobacteria bacterium]|nr:type II toxin-antitoxin system RelE/ParE family toxin [Gammaproteobacteria bacterium]
MTRRSIPAVSPKPGSRLHPLTGDMAGLWSVRVSANWRVVFSIKTREPVEVDLVDYH